mgnify:CR=1 FL=1
MTDFNNDNKNLSSYANQGTQLKDRIGSLDALRGFALFGVLLVNATMINATMMDFQSHLLNNPWLATENVDWMANLFVQVFGQGKFYTIFTFLFGLGFYLFTESNQKKNLPAKKLFVRRLFFLLIFGILHFAFVWYGDILHVYALVGFMLLPFEKASSEKILKWGVGLLIFYIVSITGIYALQDAFMGNIGTASTQGLNLTTLANQVYLDNDYFALVWYRTTVEFPQMLANLIFLFPRILGMFLLGYYVGKKQIIVEPLRTQNFFKKTIQVSLPIAIITTLAYVLIQSEVIAIFGSFSSTFVHFFEETSHIFMAFVYIGTIGVLYYRFSQALFFQALSAVGRMALTNYLTQCIILSILFYGPGLGLMYKVGTTISILVTIGLFFTQMCFSYVYLKHKPQGPAESLWRALTYN